MSAGAGASSAAAAAAAAERARRQEEEEMTAYQAADLTDGWEFKILRSVRGEFKRAERMQEILAEEARAGWALVEKFDNSRLRLKRPVSAQRNDAHLGFDPYRTYYGRSEGEQALLIVGIIFGIVLLVMLSIFAIVNAF
jgi:hypothetical protein